MKNRVCLVTGASSGIGKAAAVELAAQGARVVLLCRDRSRGEKALAELGAKTSNPDAELLLCDLASFASIRAAAEEFKSRHDRLHVLINNAGLWDRKKELTEDGFEATWGVNHLGHYLLTRLLLETLKASAPARIVNVSSGLHHRGRIVWEDLNFDRREYDGQEAYCQSKLANVLFTRELAKRLAGTGVTANAVHPGVIATQLLRNLMGPMRLVASVAFGKAEEGAKPLVKLASDPALEGVTGRYFDKLVEAEPASITKEDWAGSRLWELSARLTGLAASPPVS